MPGDAKSEESELLVRRQATPSRATRKVARLKHLHPAERRALQALKRALKREFGSDFLGLRLFGSRARGEGCGVLGCRRHRVTHADRMSDLDAVVLLRDARGENYSRVQHLASEIDLESPVCLDLRVFDPSEWQEGLDRELLFYREVERDGIAI